MNHNRCSMVQEDWATIRVPVLMAQAIDKFLDTKVAKKNGIFSRTDFATRVLGIWFSQFEKDFDLFVPREMKRNYNGKNYTKPFDPQP